MLLFRFEHEDTEPHLRDRVSVRSKRQIPIGHFFIELHKIQWTAFSGEFFFLGLFYRCMYSFSQFFKDK